MVENIALITAKTQCKLQQKQSAIYHKFKVQNATLSILPIGKRCFNMLDFIRKRTFLRAYFIEKRCFLRWIFIGKRTSYQKMYYLCTNKKVVICYTERLQNG